MNDSTNTYADKALTCVMCGEDFIFTAGEQHFYYARPIPLTEPKRCPQCRAKRRAFARPLGEASNG